MSSSASALTALTTFANDKLPIQVLGVHILIVACIVLAIFTNSFSFTPVFAFQCKNYVLNTYLYFLLTWGIALIVVYSLDQLYTQKGAPLSAVPVYKTPFRIVTAILFLGLIWVLFAVRGHIYAEHFIFLLWTAIAGVFLYYMFVRNRTIFYNSMSAVVAVLIIFSTVSVLFPDLISNNVMVYLMGILATIIVVRIVEILLHAFDVITYEETRTMSKGISYVAIVLFTLFLIYDTNLIRKSASLCNIRSNPPNYIHSSLGIFLDTLNLMSSFFDVMSD